MPPRTAQKNRTRAALLSAARALMAKGEEITVAAVADAADISRATAYRYFSDPGVIAAEAALDLDLMETGVLLADVTNVRDRVHRVAHYYLSFTRAHEGEFRQFIAQTMRQWSAGNQGEMRGARRIGAFTAALEPVHDQLGKQALDDLVKRLSLLTGIEQHIALADVLSVDDETADALLRGIIDAVLDSYLPG